jgi:TonB family protein
MASGLGSNASTGSAPDLLRWQRYADPVFPAQLLPTPVQDGFASVVFTFDDAGRITDRIVIAASHPAFTVAVIDATKDWQVDTRELAPHIRRETLRFNFQRTGSIVALSNRDAAKALFSSYGDFAASAVGTCREEFLDRPLRNATQVSADFPPEMKARSVGGYATVSFIVDAIGRVRVPAITAATNPAFAAAALVALRQWTFFPAHQRGRPVQVIVERTVVFEKPPVAK